MSPFEKNNQQFRIKLSVANGFYVSGGLTKNYTSIRPFKVYCQTQKSQLDGFVFLQTEKFQHYDRMSYYSMMTIKKKTNKILKRTIQEQSAITEWKIVLLQ